MEENIQNNQPEEITQDSYVSPDDIDLNLDEDYVMNWDQTPETDAIQERETEEVSLGEGAGDSEEMDGGLRVESDQEEYADEGESEEEDDVDYGVELGQVQDYEDESDDEDVEYEDDDEDEDDYYDDEDEEYGEDYLVSDEVYDNLPEEWQNLVDFLEDHPGASVEDYMSVQSGGADLSDEQVLKMHLAAEHGLNVEEDADELDFLYEDKFGYDDELDSERDIKLKKLEAKKALRSARSNLEEMKEKYGGDLKFGNSSPELKELQAFQQQQEELQQLHEEVAQSFQENTKNYFTNEFKGFEFNYGDGKVQRIKADPNKVADVQSDITNFINNYTGDDGQISDYAGYHKALWAAQNADALFSHAYEQGKADAVRSAARNAKNIDMDPRQAGQSTEGSQSKFKLVDEGSHTEDFKINW